MNEQTISGLVHEVAAGEYRFDAKAANEPE
jgi:hypothetical protein